MTKSSFRDRLQDIGLLVLRLACGLMLAVLHGWSKVLGAYALFASDQPWRHATAVASLGLPAPTLFALCSALAEFVGGLFLALGFLTPLAAAAVGINMGVAVGFHLRGDMRFELAAQYLFVALYLLVRGGGKYSLDAMLFGK